MFPIAKILKSNGVEGEVLAGLFTDAGEIKTKEPVYIIFDGLPVPFFIESFIPKGNTRALLRLTDVSSLEDADELVGRELLVEGRDEEPVEDFTGWKVYDSDRYIGDVDGFEDIPGNPCLSVGGSLIPLHEDFILEIDEESSILRMSLPEGLI